MQKLEILVWNGKQYVLMAQDWNLDEITVNKAQAIIKISEKPKPEPEGKRPDGPK